MLQDDPDLYTEQTDEFIDQDAASEFIDDAEMDEDEVSLAKNFDLPSEEIEEEKDQVLPAFLPKQADEFVCSKCYLVKHKSQLDHKEGAKYVCRDCA
ncbi:MAG: DUF4193 family protein [Aeriscardovia sp.]|nr:DUF4193 family protein [Aeriscardovia sp.]